MKKILLILTLAAGVAAIPVLAKTVSKTVPVLSVYQQAKLDSPDLIYRLYRVKERIARANSLDSRPWTIAVNPSCDGNRGCLTKGQVDALSDNVDALAFLVARSMADELTGSSEKVVSLKKYFSDMKAEIVTRYNNSALNDGNVTFKMGKGTFMKSKYSLNTEDNNFAKDEELKCVQADYYSQLNTLERELDRTAVKYLLTAGFDLNNAKKAIQFSKPLETLDSSVSASVFNRTKNVEGDFSSKESSYFVSVGLKNIKNSRPLCLNKSAESNVYVMCSKYGSVRNTDSIFEHRF